MRPAGEIPEQPMAIPMGDVMAHAAAIGAMLRVPEPIFGSR